MKTDRSLRLLAQRARGVVNLSVVLLTALACPALAQNDPSPPDPPPPIVEVEIEESAPAPQPPFVEQVGKEFVIEATEDFDRLKLRGMQVLSYYNQFDNPIWERQNVTPEDLYPRDADEFEDWVDDNMLDAVLEALENNPGVKRTIDRVISLFNPGVATDDSVEERHAFSDLEEQAEEQQRDKEQTLQIGSINGPVRRVLGDDFVALSRMVWLDIDDGFQDYVRWETKMGNVELFNRPYLRLDKIETELTIDEWQVKVSKAEPFDLPFLVTTIVESEDDDMEWAFIVTFEKHRKIRDFEQFAKQRRGEKVRTPLKYKVDFGLRGTDEGSAEIGFIFRGFI